MRRFWFFDLDGTLADTDRDIREAWKAALGDLQLACPDFETRFVAGPPIDEMTRLLFPDRYTPALAEAVRTGFAAHYDADGFPNTREYPGILNEVRRLKAQGDYVAIVTNKRYLGATAMARKFGWDAVFDGLFTGDMQAVLGTGPKVRKPELLARVMSEIGAAADRCTMIGDTLNDFEAARANGIRSIAVPWGYGKPEELAQADLVAVPPF